MSGTSKTRFNVEVTEADIERAHVNDSYRCVVSQAIARAVPDATRIETDIQTIRFTRDGERYVYLTPYVVQGYVVAFDAGDPIEPFSFHLRDPKRTKRRIKTEAGKAILRAESRARRGKEKGDAVRGESRTAKDEDDQVESVKAAYKDQAQTKTTPGERVPPRVHKKKQRSYGHRVLRINREETVG